jgi:hypothetical protein
VDTILKGTATTEIPVEVNTKVKCIIDLKTAKALGLTIPPSSLFQADGGIRCVCSVGRNVSLVMLAGLQALPHLAFFLYGVPATVLVR